MIELAAQQRRALALDLGAARQLRRLELLRLELAQRRDARDRAQSRCAHKQRELDAAGAELQAQRLHLNRLRSSAFSCDAWLDGLQMLELLGGQHAEHGRALEKLQSALSALDAQIDETRQGLAAAQARIELLQAQAKQLRVLVVATRTERDDEVATEEALSRARSAERPS